MGWWLKLTSEEFRYDIAFEYRYRELWYRFDDIEIILIWGLVENKLPDANLSHEEEEWEDIIPLPLEVEVDGIKKLRNYFIFQTTNERHSKNLIRFRMLYLTLTNNQHVRRRLKVYLVKLLPAGTQIVKNENL